MEVPRIPLKFNPQVERSFEDYMAQEVPSTQEESVSAAFDLANQDAGSMLIGRLSVTQDLESRGVGKISAEEANKRFPDIETPFREPVNPYIAQLQYDKQQRNMELQRKIESGPQDTWTKTKVFGAGILAHLMDPLEFGVGALMGWAAGGLAAKGALGAKVAGASAKVAQGTVGIGTRVGLEVAEAGLGNLGQNIAQEAVLAKTTVKEGGTYDPETGTLLTDLAVNTFAATAVGFGIKEGAFHLRSLKRILRETSPQADLAIARTVIGNMDQDIRPDVSPILETLAKETSVKPQDYGQPPYHYEPVTPETAGNRKFYVSTVENTARFQDGTRAPLGDDFGMGTQLTDNPGVANAAAARGMSDGVGSVHEVSLNDLKPIQLDAPIPENLKEILGEDVSITPEMTVREALQTIQNAIDDELIPSTRMNDLKQAFVESGYNSLVSDGTQRLGVDHTPHNNITVLDDALLEQRATYAPEPGIKNGVDPAYLDKAESHTMDYKNHTLVDDTKFQEMLKSLDETPGQSMESAKLKDNVQEQIDAITELEKQNLLDPNERKLFESLKEDFKDLDIQHTLVKAVASCVGG